jgi:hypothetical protein
VSHAEAFPHQRAEIEFGDVEQTFARDVVVEAQVRASHAARLQRVREAALDCATTAATGC